MKHEDHPREQERHFSWHPVQRMGLRLSVATDHDLLEIDGLFIVMFTNYLLHTTGANISSGVQYCTVTFWKFLAPACVWVEF